ncbi:hypothetical protein N7462_010684 [Penicillium macrosclerotiorum]|uniref:uncharacterized protein n=1 Tax=Penicillium macrosclerotiorum TaxID=303699 RepID=UPI002547701E|nr:uncharacterized protein N7462_010684 [Penicillium macrosclerotiorum]KAJ5669614.1 hypothetical protein N7462_010684 [Penicillium macrosclerotiorum]
MSKLFPLEANEIDYGKLGDQMALQVDQGHVPSEEGEWAALEEFLKQQANDAKRSKSDMDKMTKMLSEVSLTRQKRKNYNKKGQFECSECHNIYTRPADVERHRKTYHNKQNAIPCPDCGAQVSRKDALRRHQREHCPKRPE